MIIFTLKLKMVNSRVETAVVIEARFVHGLLEGKKCLKYETQD